MFYAQLDSNNKCIGISSLNGEVEEIQYRVHENYNPITGESDIEEIFICRMIQISHYSENYIGLIYNNGIWEIPTELIVEEEITP